MATTTSHNNSVLQIMGVLIVLLICPLEYFSLYLEIKRCVLALSLFQG